MKIQFSPIFFYSTWQQLKISFCSLGNTQHGFSHRKYIKVSWAMPIIALMGMAHDTLKAPMIH
jgi:hypothetical protein